MASEICRRCGGEVVQKDKGRLIVVGILMLASTLSGLLWWPLWVPGPFLGLIGGYLLVWAIAGQGRWCRGCKQFGGV
jgi:hypothetical protein